jgi:HD-GYP domain-containing protein (c-di-GMP phosphodiesterase class II)
MTIGEGMREMQRLSGTQFDPALVESLGRRWARGDLALSEHDVELST